MYKHVHCTLSKALANSYMYFISIINCLGKGIRHLTIGHSLGFDIDNRHPKDNQLVMVAGYNKLKQNQSSTCIETRTGTCSSP